METKQDFSTASAPRNATGTVMDVQSPRPTLPLTADEVTSAPLLDRNTQETQPLAAPAFAVASPPEVAEAPPRDESVASDSVPANVSETSATALSSNPELPPPAEATPPASAPAEPANHHSPVGAIVAAIVIAVLLAGLTVYAYLQTKDDKTLAPSKTTTTQEQTKVSGSDVDETIAQMDSSLQSADDAQDFDTTDLSDSALGL